MINDFYRAFEERFRGSRELISARLHAYIPFIKPLQEFYPGSACIDLGCGRGEWLELLSKHGLKSFGVDLDEGMLLACRERNLNVQAGDALGFLSALPDNSQVIVSAFHLVEHISFDQLRTLVLEALRVLKPGGLLIMETPNPENIAVATYQFYVDPTHKTPIPADLLSFLPEFTGFLRSKVVRLQERKELKDCPTLTLSDVFNGASPDYAVVAQKAGSLEIITALTAPFQMEFGFDINFLLERYETLLTEKFQELENQCKKLELTSKVQQKKILNSELKVKQAEVHVVEMEAKVRDADNKIMKAALEKQKTLEILNGIHSSLSWKITAPLRRINLRLKKIKSISKKYLLDVSVLLINQFRRPRIKKFIDQILLKHPKFRARLLLVVLRCTNFPPEKTRDSTRSIDMTVGNLTQRGNEIYLQLKKSMANKSRNG